MHAHVAQGALFCTINGLTQAWFHMFEVDAHYASRMGLLALLMTRLIRLIGLVLFFVGLAVNHHSDRILRNLRKGPDDTGYYIPRGGLFEVLSAPNLIGEIIEWWGFALYCQSAVSFGFALSTMAIIGNRAYGHHQWYLKKFPEYAALKRWSFAPGVM